MKGGGGARGGEQERAALRGATRPPPSYVAEDALNILEEHAAVKFGEPDTVVATGPGPSPLAPLRLCLLPDSSSKSGAARRWRPAPASLRAPPSSDKGTPRTREERNRKAPTRAKESLGLKHRPRARPAARPASALRTPTLAPRVHPLPLPPGAGPAPPAAGPGPRPARRRDPGTPVANAPPPRRPRACPRAYRPPHPHPHPQTPKAGPETGTGSNPLPGPRSPTRPGTHPPPHPCPPRRKSRERRSTPSPRLRLCGGIQGSQDP